MVDSPLQRTKQNFMMSLEDITGYSHSWPISIFPQNTLRSWPARHHRQFRHIHCSKWMSFSSDQAFFFHFNYVVTQSTVVRQDLRPISSGHASSLQIKSSAPSLRCCNLIKSRPTSRHSQSVWSTFRYRYTNAMRILSSYLLRSFSKPFRWN